MGVLLVGAIAAFGGSSARSATCTTVSTASGLTTAVIGASSGSCIQLAPGTYAVKTALDVGVDLTIQGPATAPGAVISGGAMTNPSMIDPNQLDLLAVASGATLTLHDLTLTATIQPSNGTVFVQSGGAVSIDHSLLSGNTSPGIDVTQGSQATMTNSTISNTIGFDGIILDGTATLNQDTIADSDQRAIDNHGNGTANVNNTILSNNATGNCFFAIGSVNGPGTFSNDADSGATCGFGSTNGSFSNTGRLIADNTGNNGGPTNTYALDPAPNVAIDHGTGPGAAADDERHFDRDATPDIGAYELGAVPAGAKLTVKKIVVGGTALPPDFTLTVKDTTTNTTLDSSPGSSTGKMVSVPAGDTYTVTESGAQTADYQESDSPDCAGTAVANSTPICTITNSQVATLTVKKVVVGPGQPSNFTLTVTDTTTSTVLDSSPGSSTGKPVAVPVGDDYAVTESGATVGNYTASASVDCSGTAVKDGTPTCTITNTAKPTTLTVKKVVVGGTATPSDFTLTVKDTTTNTTLDSSPGSSSGKQVSVPAGDSYTVTESGAQTADYNESNSAACAGTAPANGTPTCTITNTAKPTILTVKKVVVGPGQPSAFTLTVKDTTTNATLDSSPGSSSGKQVSVPDGDSYAVTESGAGVGNYTASASAGCTGTATLGGTASCTITNTAKPSKLTVTKVVVGGSAAASDFTLTVTDTTTSSVLDSSPGSSSGHQVSVPAGHGYKVAESGSQTANYTESDSAGCTGTATANGALSCTITNTANSPTGGGGGGGGTSKRSHLKVILRVAGGTAVPSAFKVHVHGRSVKPHAAFRGSKSGTKLTLNHGSYSVSANGPKGYKPKASGGCSGKLAAGKSKTCTITEKHH